MLEAIFKNMPKTTLLWTMTRVSEDVFFPHMNVTDHSWNALLQHPCCPKCGGEGSLVKKAGKVLRKILAYDPEELLQVRADDTGQDRQYWSDSSVKPLNRTTAVLTDI